MPNSMLNGLEFDATFELTKSASEGEGKTHYCGVLSSTAMDEDGDVMTEKALDDFAESLMKNRTVFWNHNHKWYGLGQLTKAVRNGSKLEVEWLPTDADLPEIKAVLKQVDEGVLRCMSVGGKVVNSEKRFNKALGKDVRYITAAKGFDTSVVGIGSNPDGSITGAIRKALNGANQSMTENPSNVTDVAISNSAELTKSIVDSAILSKDSGPQVATQPALGQEIAGLKEELAAIKARMTIIETEKMGEGRAVQVFTRMLDEKVGPVIQKGIEGLNAKLEKSAADNLNLIKSRALVSQEEKPTAKSNPTTSTYANVMKNVTGA